MAKVFKTLKKKAQATPIVGVILDSLKSENPTQNAPSIQAVLDNLQPKQLLINPDFQIWQRGENLSITDLSGSGGVYYHVDMWCTYNNDNSFKISKVENGAKVICTARHAITQRFDSPLRVGEKYILLAKVEGEIIKLNIIGGTYSSPNAEDPKTSLFYRKISSGKEEIGIYLKENFNGIIEWVNLWEGDIAYPHQKEDKAIALIRCQKHISPISGILNGFTDTTGKFITLQCDKIMDMEGSPIVVGNLELNLRIEGSEAKPSASSTLVKKETGEIVLTLYQGYSSLASRTISGRFESKIIVTSEPL